MNTCQFCGKRKIGNKLYCFACENRIKHGQLEEFMKRKLLEDLRYCQFIECPNRGKEFNTKVMKKVKDMFFCSDVCKRDFLKKNFITDETNA